jgi:hypothetical protein
VLLQFQKIFPGVIPRDPRCKGRGRGKGKGRGGEGEGEEKGRGGVGKEEGGRDGSRTLQDSWQIAAPVKYK